MFEVSVEGHFDAAHTLRGYGGKCEELHGHRFRVVASVEVSKLNDIGLALDFAVLKEHLKKILDSFDHHYLNDVAPFDKLNPSSENIAVTVFERLVKSLKGEIKVKSVDVFESPESHVRYYP